MPLFLFLGMKTNLVLVLGILMGVFISCNSTPEPSKGILISPEIDFEQGAYPKVYSYLAALKAEMIELRDPFKDIGFGTELKLEVKNSAVIQEANSEDQKWICKKIAKIILESLEEEGPYEHLEIQVTGESQANYAFDKNEQVD